MFSLYLSPILCFILAFNFHPPRNISSSINFFSLYLLPILGNLIYLPFLLYLSYFHFFLPHSCHLFLFNLEKNYDTMTPILYSMTCLSREISSQNGLHLRRTTQNITILILIHASNRSIILIPVFEWPKKVNSAGSAFSAHRITLHRNYLHSFMVKLFLTWVTICCCVWQEKANYFVLSVTSATVLMFDCTGLLLHISYLKPLLHDDRIT